MIIHTNKYENSSTLVVKRDNGTRSMAKLRALNIHVFRGISTGLFVLGRLFRFAFIFPTLPPPAWFVFSSFRRVSIAFFVPVSAGFRLSRKRTKDLLIRLGLMASKEDAWKFYYLTRLFSNWGGIVPGLARGTWVKKGIEIGFESSRKIASFANTGGRADRIR